MEGNVLLRNIDRKYFFGIDYIKEGEFYLPYSDLEKTFIDMVVFNQNIDYQVFRKIENVLDKEKLFSYLKRYPLKIREKVIKRYSRRTK